MKIKKRLSNGEIKIYEYTKYSVKTYKGYNLEREFDKYDLAYIREFNEYCKKTSQ